MSQPKARQIAANPKEAEQYIRSLIRENEKLRNALGPFACLGRNELRPGDFNRARRALRPFPDAGPGEGPASSNP